MAPNYQCIPDVIFRRIAQRGVLAAVLTVLACSTAQAEGVPPDRVADPSAYPVCTGWIPEKQMFGTVGIGGPNVRDDLCAEDHAYFSVIYPGNKNRPGALVHISGTCCPLPPGVLLAESVYAPEHCPDQFVATGARQQVIPSPEELSGEGTWSATRIQELRCTRIDSSRYALGAVTNGWNLGWTRSFRTMFDSYVARPSIPISLRIGMGRTTQYSWATDYCLGMPWGSVLVGKTSKHCDGMRFRTLLPRLDLSPAQHRALNTAPPEIFDYERCLSLQDPYEPTARCRALKSDAMLAKERS